jgi:hypothetical protein
MQTAETFTISSKTYRLKDAVEDLLFKVSKKHVNDTKKGNPNECALAQSIRKSYGTAYVTRTCAYILRVENERQPVVFRYKLAIAGVNAVKQFDESGIFPLGTYTLKAISPSETLQQKREQRIKYKEAGKALGIKTRTNGPRKRSMVRAKQMPKF